ncbi:MAG: radical SAM family heme chaperone HemW [Candidatus Dormibacteraeota bacterium]|nr:radical SAM family heme chaperone HemW [Candidatus Dormibacteraeota bacterium]MBV8444392.1 radical SAM family heme chaperone HemW [Candidatus Dormibacteraeota bacterium]
MIRSLYLHIPFCERKCEYCDFVSVAGDRDSAAYMDALCSEVRLLGAAFADSQLDTIFIGGGTPSLVDPCGIGRLLQTVHEVFVVAADAEITMEANPSSTSRERAAQWRAAGVNRVSLGVQSLHRATLRFLGRVHDAGRALAAIDEVRSAGIANVSCDLIYAVPTLADDEWRRTLAGAVAAGPDHISCYELTVEPGTPLHTSVRRGLTSPVDEDVALAQHRIAVETLSDAGYSQYEVSNFARPGHRCRHNLAYWHNELYLAAGVGAHGHVAAEDASRVGVAAPAGAVAVRYWHGRGIGFYIDSLRRGELPIAGWEGVDAPGHESERLLVGLRLTDGIRVGDSPAATDLARAGLVERHGGLLRVTTAGENVLNSVVERLTADAAQEACYA